MRDGFSRRTPDLARLAVRFFLAAAVAAALLSPSLPARAQSGAQQRSTLLAAGTLYEIVIPAVDYEGCSMRASFAPSGADRYHPLERGNYLGGIPAAARSYLVDAASRTSTFEIRLGPLSFETAGHCLQAPLPTLVERGPTVDALAEAVMSGELGRTRVLNGLKVGDLFYFRDLSRRESNRGHSLGKAGRMAERAALETLVYRSHFADGNSIFTREDLVAASQQANAFTRSELEAAVEAHANAGIAYDAMLALGVNGHDNRGGSFFNVVNLPFPIRDTVSTCSGGIIKAGSSFSAVSLDNVLAYSPPGEYGNLRHLNSYASLLDVVAHEYAHAIISSASDLAYRGESGALNEAFSDWVAVAVQAFATGRVDWRIGEGRKIEVISSGAAGELQEIRSLAAPERRGQPRRVGGIHWENPDCGSPHPCNDYCGVHTNSGVANHAFYLMAEGSAETRALGVSAIPPFAGIGLTTAIKVGIYANLNLWSREETLASAADDMVLAAARIHGDASPQVEVVECAWLSVGVSHSGDCKGVTLAPGVASGGRRIEAPLDPFDVRLGGPFDFQVGGFFDRSSLLWLLCLVLARQGILRPARARRRRANS